MTVICDTNIWYNIGDGQLDPERLKKFSLVATFYNFEELITTPNLKTNFQQVRLAAKAIVDHSSDQILENAFLYLAKLIDPLFEDKHYHYNLGMRNWGEVRRTASLDATFQPHSELNKEFDTNIQNRSSIGDSVAANENQFVSKVKNHSRKLWKQNPQAYFKERFRGIVLELNDYMNVFSEGRINNIGSKHLKNCELFLTAFLQFARNAEVAKWKVQPNDAYDLYNLIFVKPGDKYFTLENRWINLITEAGLSHYLLKV